MAIKRELIIEVSPTGEIKIKTEGFKGADCEQELKPIEKALGTVTKRTKTGDYFQTSSSKRKVSNSAK